MSLNRPKFAELFDFKVSITDIVIQGIFMLIVATSGVWQRVPIAYLIPAILLTIFAIAAITRLYGTTRSPLTKILGATLPRATPEDLASREIAGKSLYLYDVVRDETVLSAIRGKVFRNCEIFGPAIMAPVMRTTFTRSAFTMTVDNPDEVQVRTGGMFWAKDPKELQWGAIQIDHCIFEECKFMVIGIAGKPEDIEQIAIRLGRAVDAR
jgi:hypothetical protein